MPVRKAGGHILVMEIGRAWEDSGVGLEEDLHAARAAVAREREASRTRAREIERVREERERDLRRIAIDYIHPAIRELNRADVAPVPLYRASVRPTTWRLDSLERISGLSGWPLDPFFVTSDAMLLHGIRKYDCPKSEPSGQKLVRSFRPGENPAKDRWVALRRIGIPPGESVHAVSGEVVPVDAQGWCLRYESWSLGAAPESERSLWQDPGKAELCVEVTRHPDVVHWLPVRVILTRAVASRIADPSH